MKLKTILHLMPKPIDFLLPSLHRRNIKIRTRKDQTTKLMQGKIGDGDGDGDGIYVLYFPHLTIENGPIKKILRLMVGLSRRHLRPKPIDFLLPWLHRRDIKSRRRILVNIWSLNTKCHRLADDHESLFNPYIIGSQSPGSKDRTKNLMQGKIGDGDGDGDGIDADIFHILQEKSVPWRRHFSLVPARMNS